MAREPREPTPLEIRQAELFLLPEEPQLPALVKKWQHNAKTTMKDELRCFAVCELLFRKVGIERIAHQVNMSPHTVRAIRAEFHDGGKLAGFKERITTAAKEFMVDAVESLHVDLLTGNMTPSEKSVAVGILADKVRDWEGGPGLTVRHEHVQVIDIDQVNKFLEAGLAPDGASIGLGSIPQQLPATSTAGPGFGPALHSAGPVLDAEIVHRPAGPTREGGGGDRTSMPARAEADVSDSTKFSAKEIIPPPAPETPPT